MHASKVMVQDTLGALKHNMLHVLQTHSIDTKSADVQELCTKFSYFENPYYIISSYSKQYDT
jgi:hypothetical protein